MSKSKPDSQTSQTATNEPGCKVEIRSTGQVGRVQRIRQDRERGFVALVVCMAPDGHPCPRWWPLNQLDPIDSQEPRPVQADRMDRRPVRWRGGRRRDQ